MPPQARPQRIGDVEHRDPLGLRPERRPEAVAEERHVPGRAPDIGPVDDPVADEVEDDDLAAGRVRDVGEAAVGGAGRVARRAEAAQHAANPQVRPVDQRDRAAAGVGDDRGAADALDAARACERRDPALDPAVGEPDDGHVALRVCGHQGDRQAAEASGESVGRGDEQHARSRRAAEELTPVHARSTRSGPQVRGGAAGSGPAPSPTQSSNVRPTSRGSGVRAARRPPSPRGNGARRRSGRA